MTMSLDHLIRKIAEEDLLNVDGVLDRSDPSRPGAKLADRIRNMKQVGVPDAARPAESDELDHIGYLDANKQQWLWRDDEGSLYVGAPDHGAYKVRRELT